MANTKTTALTEHTAPLATDELYIVDNTGPTSKRISVANIRKMFAVSADLSGVLSDETGSGSLVFASSPTLVTPVLGAATGTSLDLGGTTLYGSRAITVDTGGALNVVLAAAAGDDFTVDTDKLVVSGDSGDIGIGVAAPDHKLDIDAGTDRVQIRSLNEPALQITENDADALGGTVTFEKSRGSYASPGDVVNNDGIAGLKTKAWSGSMYWDTARTDFAIDGTFTSNQRPPSRITFSTNEANAAVTERMRIDDAGNIGINTSAPTSTLHVVGTVNVRSSSSQYFHDSTNGLNLSMVDGGAVFNDDGSDKDFRMESDGDANAFFLEGSSGNVGIGVGALAHPLEVQGGVNNISPYRVPIATFRTDSYAQYLSITGDGSGASGGVGIQNGRGTGVPEIFITSGKVGINNTSPSHALHVKAVDADIAVESTTGTNSTSFKAINTGGTLSIGLEENTGGIIVPGSGAYAAIMNHSGAYGMSFATSNTRRLNIDAAGTVHVFGTFTAGTKTFQIPHPLPELKDTHYLIHGCLEGPRLDLIYRGTVTLVAGAATVDLDESSGMTAGTWALLCRDAQVFTTNETGWFHVRGTVSGSTLTIECEEGTCTDTVSWMVVAERQDDEIKAQSSTDEDGHLILEPLQVEEEPDSPVEDEEDDNETSS